MPINSLTDLIAALQQGDHASIIGTPESDWLDFKQTAYFPFDDEHKLELAKDVTALANHRGGVLVIGFSTAKDVDTPQDRANALTRVRRDTVKLDQYRSAIEALTYPPIRNLELRWWLVDGDDAVLTIEVPAAGDSDKPVVVVKVREEGSRKEILLGIFERSGDVAARVAPAQLHAQIQLGRLIQTAGFGALTPAAESPVYTEEQRERRREEDLRDVGLLGQPHIWLQAWPADKAEVGGSIVLSPEAPATFSLVRRHFALRDSISGPGAGPRFCPVVPFVA